MRAIKLKTGLESSREPQPSLLADLLEVLQLRSCILGIWDSRTPLAIRFNKQLGWIHLAGMPCSLELELEPQAVPVAAGDLIIVFPGRCHHLSAHAAAAPKAVEDVLDRFHCCEMAVDPGQMAEPLTSVLCGHFALHGFERTQLYASLPAMIHIRGCRERPLPFIEHLVQLGIEEMASPEPCTPLIVNRLVLILLIKVIHQYASTATCRAGHWLGAIRDPDIGLAMALLHEQPESPWTVAAIAERVAMSRSVFSARFTALVGKPPLSYLFEWRMLKASQLLRTARTQLKEIAAKVGYDSTAAFSRAFTRWAGVPPAVYRRSVQAGT